MLIFELDDNTYDICSKIENPLNLNKKIFGEFQNYGLFMEYEKYVEQDSDVAYLSIPTVHSCNMRCSYCFAEAGEKYQGKERRMQKDVLDKTLFFFLNRYKNISKYRIDFVSGGEPTINFEVIQYVNEKLKEICNKDYMIWFATNGLAISESILEYLQKNNIQFGISMDGIKNEHDKFRKDCEGKGTYDRVVANISKIKENRNYSSSMRDIWILTTITAETNSLVDIIKTYKALGIKRAQIKIARVNQGNILGLNDDNVEKFLDLYTEFVSYLKKEIDKGDLTALNIIMNRNDLLGRILMSLILREPCITRCMAGRDKISITADGSVYPCESFIGVGKFKLGDIYKGINVLNPFENINVYSQNKCSICWARYICGGGCYYRNYLETNMINKGSNAYCSFYLKLIEKAIDLIAYINANDKIASIVEKIALGKRKLEW